MAVVQKIIELFFVHNSIHDLLVVEVMHGKLRIDGCGTENDRTALCT